MTFFTVGKSTFSTQRKADNYKTQNPDSPAVESHEMDFITLREMRRLARTHKPKALSMAQIAKAVKAMGIKTLKPDEHGNITIQVSR